MKPGKSLTLALLILVGISLPKMRALEYGMSLYHGMPSLVAAPSVDTEPEQRAAPPAADAGGNNAAVTGVILSIWAGLALFVVILSRKLARVEREVADVLKHERDKS